ncbi:MAG: 1,4-alpha-glucan branching enzyme [Pseudoalteromonas tetraodonis]|jgi:1,4-alpha-glucan branching enzyme
MQTSTELGETEKLNQKSVTEKRKKAANHGKRRILLKFKAEPGTEVFVAGDFNGWDHTQHRLTDRGHPGQFRRYIFVVPGRYEYKFNIDGEWQIDPNCAAWSPNRFGSLNSVIDASQ